MYFLTVAVWSQTCTCSGSGSLWRTHNTRCKHNWIIKCDNALTTIHTIETESLLFSWMQLVDWWVQFWFEDLQNTGTNLLLSCFLVVLLANFYFTAIPSCISKKERPHCCLPLSSLCVCTFFYLVFHFLTYYVIVLHCDWLLFLCTIVQSAFCVY